MKIVLHCDGALSSTRPTRSEPPAKFVTDTRLQNLIRIKFIEHRTSLVTDTARRGGEVLDGGSKKVVTNLA
jgi:hypothetical protein